MHIDRRRQIGHGGSRWQEHFERSNLVSNQRGTNSANVHGCTILRLLVAMGMKLLAKAA
jgi:hypothetical protein